MQNSRMILILFYDLDIICLRLIKVLLSKKGVIGQVISRDVLEPSLSFISSMCALGIFFLTTTSGA
jgi:hypothetical protein